MSDNQPARSMSILVPLILPCVCLVITLAAFGLGAPVKLAHLTQRPAILLTGLEFDASIRYEPLVFTDQADFRLVGARRVLDALVNRQLIAFK